MRRSRFGKTMIHLVSREEGNRKMVHILSLTESPEIWVWGGNLKQKENLTRKEKFGCLGRARRTGTRTPN